MILLICLSRDQHQYKKATELLQKSLDIRAEFLGESHPVVSQWTCEQLIPTCVALWFADLYTVALIWLVDLII